MMRHKEENKKSMHEPSKLLIKPGLKNLKNTYVKKNSNKKKRKPHKSELKKEKET